MRIKYALATTSILALLAGPALAQAPATTRTRRAKRRIRAGGSNIVVQQPAPAVTVKPNAPNVNVQAEKPDVKVTQPPPQVIVNTPPPNVQVQTGQPEVKVLPAEKPNVTVNQTPNNPDVNVGSTAAPNASSAGNAAVAPAAGTYPVAKDVEKLIGKDVYGANGKKVGELNNVLIDPDGKVRAGIIEFGGFLGIGEHRVAVPWNQLNTQGDRVTVNMTEDQIKIRPDLEQGQADRRIRRVQTVSLSAQAIAETGVREEEGRAARPSFFYACSSSIRVPQKSFGCRNSTGLSCAPSLRLAVAEHAGAAGAQPVAGGEDVVDLVADMVHAAGRVLVEKAAHRRIGPERLQQFDLAVRQLDKDDRDAVRRQRVRLRHAGAERVAVERRGGGEVRHDDRDMVEPADHPLSAGHCFGPSRTSWISISGRLPKRSSRDTRAQHAARRLAQRARRRAACGAGRALDRVGQRVAQCRRPAPRSPRRGRSG